MIKIILGVILPVVTLFIGAQNDDLIKSINRGKEIYTDFCVTCHKVNGEGTPRIFPPLAKSDYLLKNRKESIYGLKYGMSGKITVNGIEYNSVMTTQGLEDDEIADVMNYILNSWGNEDGKIVTPDEVKAVKNRK